MAIAQQVTPRQSSAEIVGGPRDKGAATRGRSAVKVWALIGGALIVFEAIVLARWISGPYFKQVPAESTPMPGWMQPVLDVWQVAGVVAAAGFICGFVIRPWRRSGHMTTDGMFVVAFATLWFQDPLSAYFGHWFTYNTHLVNFGSWVKDVPGWSSFGKPGAMIAEPIVLIGPVYVYFIMTATLLGCAVMRAAKRRWPALRPFHLIALCFLLMALVDVVGEGLVWLPLGFWEYPGGIPFLFSGTYHQFPLNEMLTIAASFTAITSLRYFRIAQDRTVPERDQRVTADDRPRRSWVRLLAVIGAVHVALVLCYNVPNSIVGTQHLTWPQDLQQRSYLTDQMCGPGTVNLCPGNGHGLVEGGRANP